MPHTTKQVADIAKVSEQTVRNYTGVYGELLSPGARGEGGARLFTDDDVRIFCSIAALRKENVPPPEVIERLRRGDIYIDATDHTTPHQATQAPTNATEGPQAIILVRQDLQRQINEIKHTQALLLRAATLWGALLGAIAALAFVGVVVWLLWFFGG